MKSQQSLQDDAVLGELIDEIAGRIQAGEPVDLNALFRNHPERADELRELLPAIHVMADLGELAAEEEAAASSHFRIGQEIRTLGDYRILREVGRGGMGIVYEAEQVSLGRRVALKVLPFAATMDPRHLDRFRNEAQAAAQLHHNHIVPVFGVGCERGVHYYAMQFIEGQTLAEVIHDLAHHSMPDDAPSEKEPDRHAETRQFAISTLGGAIKSADYFRKVAQLGIQAAEALDYAHQSGVIHRDIKPGNLILDACGNLWITDFGLANFQGNDARLTRTGDLVGTVRYMSPEQASPSRRLSLDPRSDIYSLGVTLYELLTLEPAFSAQDRAEILVQLANQEPRLPRSLNSAVPHELETIVLKAMAKIPDERYATAQELTDDLRRFLEDQPIKARRPTLAQRWRKWARRHRALVRAVAGAAIFAVAALIVALCLVWNEKNKTLAAYQDKENAFRAEQIQRWNSENNVDLAMQTLDEIYLSVAERWSPRESSSQSQDREILEKALVFYELFAQENTRNLQARKEIARAYLRAGDVCTLLGKEAKAEGFYRKAIERFQDLADEFPQQPSHRQNLGCCLANLGAVLENTRRLDKAVQFYRRAIAQREKLKDAFPAQRDYRQELADSYHRLGAVFSAGDQIKEAETAFAQAMSIQKQLVAEEPKDSKSRFALAAMHRDLAHLLWRNGRLAQAEGLLKQGQLLLEPEAAPLKAPTNVKYQARLAALQDSFGTMFFEIGKAQEAETALRRAIKSWKELATEYPNVPGFQLEVAASQDHLGALYRDLRRRNEAKEMFCQALAILEPLTSKLPDQPKVRDVLGDTLNNLACVHGETGQSQEAEKLFRRALTLRQNLVNDYPNIPEYRRGLACVHHHLGFLLQPTRTDEAEKAYRQGIAILSTLVKEIPRGAAYRFRLAWVYHDLGRLLKSKKNNQAAEAAFQSALEQLELLLAGAPHMLSFQVHQALVLRDLGDLLAATARFDRAEKAYRRCLALKPNDAAGLNNLAWLLVTCPDAQMHNPAESLELVKKALSIARNGPCGWNPKYGWNTMGVAFYRAGNWQKAREALNRSMKLNSGGDANDWFFLAMTCWKLGEETEARMWYTRANDWMLEHRPNDQELQRFQKEADTLLHGDAPAK